MHKFYNYVFAMSVVMVGTQSLADKSRPKVKRAFYSVPVAPELAQFATFELINVDFTETDQGLSFFYNLPPELVGPDAKGITLSQDKTNEVSDLHKMVGKQEVSGHLVNVAEASCGKHPLQNKKVQCMVVYHSMSIDQQKTNIFVVDQYHASPNLALRLQVAAAFGNEPSGVLVVDLE
jgi:hypothetical protein